MKPCNVLIDKLIRYATSIIFIHKHTNIITGVVTIYYGDAQLFPKFEVGHREIWKQGTLSLWTWFLFGGALCIFNVNTVLNRQSIEIRVYKK